MNEEDKLELIKKYERLIYKISTKFYGLQQEELFQVGVIGLIKAYKNFKDDGITKFTTYAYKYIFGEMYDLANKERPIKLNKDILKTYKKIEETKYKLAQKLNYIPTITELSLYLCIPEQTIIDIYKSTETIMSLDNDEEKNIYECIPDKIIVSSDDTIDLNDSLNSLTDQEKQIIEYRYFKDYTQTETAKVLGLSQVKVSRYEKKSLNKMYNYLTS